MMLTFYEKPTCTTCRKTATLLAEHGVDFERVNYYVEPLGEDKLRELLAKAGLRPREAMRTKEPVYRELGLARADVPDEELIRLMAEHPDLVRRPIVERGDRAVLARPPEKVLETGLTAAAFFDLDRTLMAGSSAYHFGRAMYKAGHMSRRQIMRDAIDQVRFRLKGASDAAVNVLLERVLAGIKGQRVVDLRRMTPDVLAGILPRVYPQMLDVVRSHQDAGRPCYIATAASQPAAEILAEALVMDGAMGTCWEIEDGVYTGRLDGPFAYGEGKAQRLRQFAAERDIDLEQSWAYTDAVSDLPMLEAVGHPVAVNPDAELAEVAKREGWEVLRFEKLGERLRVAVAVAGAAAVGGSGSWLATRSRGGRVRGRIRRSLRP